MLPQKIIFAVFAAVLSQGSIVSALPQGQYARSEYIGGEANNEIAAREPAPVAFTTDINPTSEDNHQVTARALDTPTKIALAGLLLGVSGVTVKDGVVYFCKETELGKKMVKAGKAKAAKVKKVAQDLLSKAREIARGHHAPEPTEGDVELGLQQIASEDNHGEIMASRDSDVRSVSSSSSDSSGGGVPLV